MERNWLDAVQDMGLDIMLAIILALIAIDLAHRFVHRLVERRLRRDGQAGTGSPGTAPAFDVRTADAEWLARWLGDIVAKDVPASRSTHGQHTTSPSRRVA